MKFKTDDTLTPLVAKAIDFATPETLRSSVEQVKEARGVDFWALTFGDFITLQSGDTTPLGVAPVEMMKATVGDYLLCKGWLLFLEDFANTMKRLTPPASTMERQASQACMEVDFNEAMYVFLRKYFSLHSFRDAERITLGDIVLAKKSEYNEIISQRKISELMSKKMKLKK